MKLRNCCLFVVGCLSLTMVAFEAEAANVTPDVIFGTGNANGSWTVDQSNGIELGLRGKLRFNENNLPENTFNWDGDRTYYFAPGAAPGGFNWLPNSPTTPVWSFEWSINSDYTDPVAKTIGSYTYEIGIDFDPSSSTNYLAFDPIHEYDPNVKVPDHAFGDNSTGNGGGVSAGNDQNTYLDYLDTYNVAQNSWNMEFFNDDQWDTFDPNVAGTYTFYLKAFDQGTQVAGTEMDIVVTPEPGTMLLLGAGLVGAAVMVRRRRR